MKKLILQLACVLLLVSSAWAATVTDAGGTWNTTAGNKTVVATPTAGDLVVVIHGMSGWASGDTSVLSDNNTDGLGAYTQCGGNPRSNEGGTGGALWISIRNATVGSATSTTFTVTNTGDTGGGLSVFFVSGMSRVGCSAALQTAGESTQTENPPSIAFAGATLAGNPLIIGVLGEDNPPALTSPTGFTESEDTGWATPTTGVQNAFDSDGNTLSSYAWSAGALVDHNEVAVELDTSAAPSCIPRRTLLGVGC